MVKIVISTDHYLEQFLHAYCIYLFTFTELQFDVFEILINCCDMKLNTI